MPETISNTQSQQLTTSDDGLNIKPVLQPESHFVIQNNVLEYTFCGREFPRPCSLLIIN